jgi:hypothetical protein
MSCPDVTEVQSCSCYNVLITKFSKVGKIGLSNLKKIGVSDFTISEKDQRMS